MQHFRINSPDDQEPEREPHLYEVGTVLTFSMIGDRLKAAIHIPVTILS
jgi:hypothetical protein